MKGTAMDDYALMGLYADTLFTYDARGRMLYSNEPRLQERRPAPRLFLGRTRGGSVARFGASMSDTLAQRLAEIVDRLPPPADLGEPATPFTEIEELLKQDAPIIKTEAGPVYHFPAAIRSQGEAIRLTEANIAVVRDTYPSLLEEFRDWSPCFVALDHGRAVSICMSSRVTPDAEAAGVDTLPGFRGRGYAAAATAAWGAAIREAGRVPFYSTWWDNMASQGVARRCGLIQFGADTSWS
jgi:hypothetical protein